MSECDAPLGRSIGGARAIWLLLGLRWRRLINHFVSGLVRRGRRAEPGARTGTPPKPARNTATALLFGAMFGANSFNLAWMEVQNVTQVLGESANAPVAALVLGVLFVTSVTMSLAMSNRDLARVEPDLEWLMTLPVPVEHLYLAKVVEQSVLNLFGWFTVAPLLTVLGWESGLGWWAPVSAGVLTLLFLCMTGVLRVVVECGVRLWCPAPVMRNLQAGATLASMLGMMVALAPAVRSPDGAAFPWTWLAAAPDWLLWLPFGLPALLSCRNDLAPDGRSVAWGLFLVQSVLVLWVSWRVLQRLTVAGPVQGRGLLQGKRGAAARPARFPALRGIVGKELRLLMRDRSFLVSTLLVPVFIIGIQFVFNPQFLERALADARHGCAIAFGLGAYVLMFSSAHVLSTESRSLWLLYTLPCRLDTLLLQKTALWAGASLLYTGAVLAWLVARVGVDLDVLSAGAFALAGIPVFSVIGGALGVFGCDPLVEDPRQRIRQDIMYLFMLLQGIYIYGFYAGSAWPRFVLLILLVGLALALWQKVRRQMPYLLDPVAMPAARLTLGDGMIAALLFFLLQGVMALVCTQSLGLEPGPGLLMAFAAAGALTVFLMLYTFWRYGVKGIWSQLGVHAGRGVGWAIGEGAAWALPAMAGAAVYLKALEWWPAWQAMMPATPPATVEDAATLQFWFALLAVCAAPPCEEIIFRGMIFRGLREGYGALLSILVSAALFAIVHPPVSVLPVFGLGCCAALAFERTGTLLAPIITHALYNAAILWLQRAC